jgi:hypothetical protein
VTSDIPAGDGKIAKLFYSVVALDMTLDMYEPLHVLRIFICLELMNLT